MLEKVEENEIYRNKNTKEIFQVEDFATHTETLETMVCYYSVKDVSNLKVTPLDKFKEIFETI